MQPYPPYGAPPPAMAPAYGMPQPGYYPPPPPPRFETREGVKFMSYNLLLQLVSSIIAFVVALAAAVIILGNADNWTVGATAAIGTLVAVAGIVLLLAVISFILFLISLYKFYEGKMEFGPEHDKNVIRGIIYWLLSFLVPIIGSVVAGALTVGMILSGNLAEVASGFRLIVIVAGVMAIVGAFFQALMYRSFVKIFTAEEVDKFKYGTILLMINPIIGLIAGAVAIPENIASGAQGGVGYLGNLGAIIGVIAIWYFYQGYKSILNKMESGAIRPMMPPPMMMAPPGYAPPPMQPQPYQPPAGAPQPYQPPPQSAPPPYRPPPPQP